MFLVSENLFGKGGFVWEAEQAEKNREEKRPKPLRLCLLLKVLQKRRSTRNLLLVLLAPLISNRPSTTPAVAPLILWVTVFLLKRLTNEIFLKPCSFVNSKFLFYRPASPFSKSFDFIFISSNLQLYRFLGIIGGTHESICLFARAK